MGTVYKATFTKPLPAAAEIFTRKGERFARFQDAKGRSRTEAVTTAADGTDRLLIVAGTYTAKYRDGSGVVRKVATGCRDKTAAESLLGDLERRAELVKAGVMTSAENAVADHQSLPLSQHVAAYVAHLTAKGVSPVRIKSTLSRLNRVATDCRFNVLADLNPTALVAWLNARAAGKMSAGTRNGYREALIGFGNWCRKSHRLIETPFAMVPKADAKADCRRKRRSLTEAELVKLLDVASRRPLLDAMTIRRGEKIGQVIAHVNGATRVRLESLGRERALIYKTLILTGLRKGELASLTVGQLELDEPTAYAVLNAADEKNGRGSDIPLRADLVDDLRAWINAKLAVVRAEAFRHGEPVPSRLPDATPLFTMPAGLVRILDRDLKAAGIAKRDERGWTVDVHALRHSFGTLLSKAGVAPRTAQAAMRHSSIDLTMNVYTDPKLLDIHAALNSLPSLHLQGGPQSDRIVAKLTGTDDSRLSSLVPLLVPTHGKPCTSESFTVKMTGRDRHRNEPSSIAVSDCPDKEKHPSTIGVKGCHLVGVTGRLLNFFRGRFETGQSP